MRQDPPRIAILTDYFLHPTNGSFLPTPENMSLLTLAVFCRDELGWTVHIYQMSPHHRREFRALPVFGIDAANDRNGMYPELNFAFAQLGLDYEIQVYYHWHLAFPNLCPRSIVVSQGIFWDSPSSVLNRQNAVGREEWAKRLLYAIAGSARFVVQDRNTANVIKATWPGYDHRLVYVPPGVDLTRFRPCESRPVTPRTRVVCPQDFGLEHGLNEILSLCEVALTREPSMEFHIIGRMREFSTAILLAKRVRSLPNCLFYWMPTHEWPAWCRRFDLALLPYRACAGASLHALEALASGLPVVAGLAGGLSELVVDGWNGRLVAPGAAKPYLEALLPLAGDEDLRLRMGANARRLAEGYPVSSWRARWQDLLLQVLGARDPGLD